MAIIDTNQAGFWMESIPELVRKLRSKMMEELDAINSYEGLQNSIRMMGTPDTDGNGEPRTIPPERLSIKEAEELSEMVGKIRAEELDHLAFLTKLIDDLDPEVLAAMAKGLNAL